MLSLLLTTPLPQLGLRNVTVTWGIAAKMSSRCGDLDKRCHPTEEATRGQSALGCRQRVAEMLLELRGPRSCRGAFGSAARASAISSAPRHAGLDGGGLNPPHSKESIAASSLHQRSGIVFPSQPLLLDGRADAKSRAASHRPRRAGDSRMEARDAFIPRSPSRSWDRRRAPWAPPGLQPLWLHPFWGRVF